MRVLAIGDIHTKKWIIDAAISEIDNYDAVVFVGDYADDWKATAADSIDTWIYLKMLQETYPDKIYVLAGNHDFIYAFKTPSLQSGYNQVTQLMINASDMKHLKDWLINLPIQVDLDNVTYTHAGRDANWNTSIDVNFLWSDDSPIWNRPNTTIYGPEAQVFGHTPMKTCTEVQENVWCIDTYSTYPDGTPVGDQTALKIVDGKTFKKVKIHNDRTTNSDDHLAGISV